MSIISLMSDEAQILMHRRKKIEEERKKYMARNIENMYREIYQSIKHSDNINISFLPYFISNEIKPIVDKYKNQQKIYLDSFVRADFQTGQDSGHRFLSLANEEIPPLDRIGDSSKYEEVLLALLLFGEDVLENMHNDLIGIIQKDISSMYIFNKNYNAQRDIKSNNGLTLNTVLSGAVISSYINGSFRNIKNRTDMTAQNESNRSLNHGIMMSYLLAKTKRKGLNGLMVKWIQVQDERTCQYCRDAAYGGDLGDGVYEITEITPPPIHSRCRCTLIPFLYRWE